MQTAVTFCGFIVTELQIYQNFTKRPVLQNFSTRIIQRPRHYLWTSWSIFTPTLPILLLYDWIFPIHRGRVIRIANPCSLFHTFYIFFHHRNLSRRIASDPTFMEISNMLNILQSLSFLLPLRFKNCENLWNLVLFLFHEYLGIGNKHVRLMEREMLIKTQTTVYLDLAFIDYIRPEWSFRFCRARKDVLVWTKTSFVDLIRVPPCRSAWGWSTLQGRAWEIMVINK